MESSKPWRLRDAAQQLKDDRLDLWEETVLREPLVSTRFDHDAADFKLQEKIDLLPSIFDIAATTLIRAIEKQSLQQVGEDTRDEEEKDFSTKLPVQLLEYKELQKKRIECLRRSHENKEYAKRKGVKEEESVSDEKVIKMESAFPTPSLSVEPVPSASSEGPKFTRNTPASSAAALDFRFTSSRAILCAAGNMAWTALTPGNDMELLAVPQNPEMGKKQTSNINLGAVVIEAQTLGQRTIQVVQNAVRRSDLRHQNKLDHHKASLKHSGFLKIPNPFDWRERQRAIISDDDDSDHEMEHSVPYQPNVLAMTEWWQNECRNRFLGILEKGAGHAIYHDLDWDNRHGRIADLLKDRMGPHLILTTEPEIDLYAQEFFTVQEHLELVTANETRSLRALPYGGSKKNRRQWRRYFSQANGLPDAPFHVLVTSFKIFFEDYLHFCQIPFDITVVDNGVGLMAAAQGDTNSSIHSLWDTGIFSTNDQHIGLAGTPIFKEWDFQLENIPANVAKEAKVGLTTRHRIVTTSTFATYQRNNVEVVPVSSLVSFVLPHFADCVREEWDRSRIASDVDSMDHFRQLVSRSMVVHHSGDVPDTNMDKIAVKSLLGSLGSDDLSSSRPVPRIVPDEEFVSSGKASSSRRWVLSWLGTDLEKAWLRYELGTAKLEPILDVMKLSHTHGHMCEEVTTASSTTSSGASGQVAGTLAYRMAVCCGRHFGSEPGLRQHISALHAPPGTWLCRTCSTDCVTSMARTHHERSCGVSATISNDSENMGNSGAPPTVGQGGGPKSGVGKKKGGRPGAAQSGSSSAEEKDPDGSIRVPGYRGVWINPAGKHFIKIDGERVMEDESAREDSVLLFDAVDDAARKYDEIICMNKKKNQHVECNFSEYGSRIVYEDILSTTSGLGGSAANVVPALSVINIKDLPPDVKPLLRDPRQTSRTGGNSKRHVYAYRGVCRQARKGHDRWQSQISFMGQNHYLGTFDSEWDAAAIYAWAHLILYGEEATRQAQKEGEEAAAAYEREKKDIAEGIISAPVAKLEKKKRVVEKTKDGETDEANLDLTSSLEKPLKRKRSNSGNMGSEKKAKVLPEKKGKSLMTTVSARLKESITGVITKGVARATILSRQCIFETLDDVELMAMAAKRLKAARNLNASMSPASPVLRPCVSVDSTHRVGIAMLIGVSPMSSGWDLQSFADTNGFRSNDHYLTALQLLAVEYDEDGDNEKFISVIQGTVCVIGCAHQKTRQAYQRLGLGSLPLGGTVGRIDCHIGGVLETCSESSACIRFAPTPESDFQMSCLAHDDVVTVNGRRLHEDGGSVPLRSGDICSVGARVFSFVVATK